MFQKKRNSAISINPLLIVTIIGITIVSFAALTVYFPFLTYSLHNLFISGDLSIGIAYLILLIFMTAYFGIYLYINRFFTRISFPIFITVVLFFLLFLTSASIRPREEPVNIETLIYIFILGFLLLFIFVFTVEEIRSEKIIETILFVTAVFAIIVICLILIFLFNEGFPVVLKYGLFEFLLGTEWVPDSFVEKKYGAIPLIWGTLVTSFGAIIISVPISLAVAIFIAEIAPERLKLVIKPAIELLAGIPSVVIGFFGLVVLVPFLQEPLQGYFFLPSGTTSFAGMLILAVMALPTITSVAEDAISSVPQSFKEGSLALGATNWQTISRVTVPTAISGITAAIILGMGRAIGETMAVMMVIGNSALLTFDIFSSMRTITAALAIEMGEAGFGTLHYHALFGLAVILLLITLTVNMVSIVIIERLKVTRKKPDASSGLMKKWNKYKPIMKIIGFVFIVLIVSRFLSETFTIFGAIAFFLSLVTLYLLKKHVYDRLQAKNKQRIAYALIDVAVVSMLLVLLIVVSYIFFNGIPALNPEFLTQPPKGLKGGIFPAIVGTIYLVIGTITFALPIGVCAAIYLVEYQKEGRVTKLIRSGFDLLNGTPSIVFGLFGFAFFVLSLDWGFSMLAGQITLGLMILPTILRTTEESLKSIPQTVREGSLALGASKWQTIRRVVLPPALPGIITGSILSIGRAAGETAPILFTAAVFVQPDLPSSLFDAVMALPYHLYVLTEYPASSLQRFGTALVLLILVVSFYFIAIIIRNYYRKRIRW